MYSTLDPRAFKGGPPVAYPCGRVTVCLHPDRATMFVYFLIGQLRSVHKDQGGAGREPDEEIQLGAGPDQTHEGI